jgi:hypothetical protein
MVLDIHNAVSRSHVVTPAQHVQTPALETVCPYRGLEVFREEDVRFFFGREALTDQLLTKVTK